METSTFISDKGTHKNKTKVLTKGPTGEHVFNHTKHFLDTNPDLVEIDHHFTRDMFTTEGEVLGSPVN
jgi:hypothetical protein